MSGGDIIPTLLRAAPAMVVFWMLVLAIKSRRYKKPSVNGNPQA